MGKKLTAPEIGQHVIDNPSTGFDQCCKCQGIETQGAMKDLDDSEPFADELICDECSDAPEAAKPCGNCKFDMGPSYENCGASEDGICPECGTIETEEEYEVSVCRTGYGFAKITVTASSAEEAENKALDEAGDHEYSEKSSEYTTDGATAL